MFDKELKTSNINALDRSINLGEVGLINVHPELYLISPGIGRVTSSLPSKLVSSLTRRSAGEEAIVVWGESFIPSIAKTNQNLNKKVNTVPGTVYNQQAIRQLEAGKLPGVSTGGRTGVPREMAPSSNPNAMAEDFVIKYVGRRPTQQELIDGSTMYNGNCPGCWKITTKDGTTVSYRPAGNASNKTSDTTATVEINNARIKELNLNKKNEQLNLKLKFPVRSEVKK